MSLYAYFIFETVVDQSSFVKAANILNLTPSAVSHAIAKLESDLGFQLLIRHRNGIRLTGEGEKILPFIRDLQRSNENLEQKISQIFNLESGIIRIGTFNSVTVNWLPRIIQTFRVEHPNIEIRILQGSYNDILEWINDNSVDLAFISNTTLPQHIKSIPLYKDRIMCVVPKGFVPQNSGYITVEDIKDMNFVMQREDYDQEALKILKKYHLSVCSQFYIETDNAIISMVEAGFGTCIMSELICKCCVGNVDIYPFVPENYRTIGLVCANPQCISPVVKKMKNHIIDFINKNNFTNL